MHEEPLNSDTELRDELYEHHRFEVDKRQEPLRIDKYLLHRIEGISRNKLQNAARAGSILVDGKPVKSNYKVRPGDVITIVLSVPPRDFWAEPENIPLDIVFEDESLLVVNKPPGLVVHPAVGNFTGTLVNALLYHLKNNKNWEKRLPVPAATAEIRPGLVHRLDKDTSGLMVIAKEEYAMMHLAKQFFTRTIKRNYSALVWGDFNTDSGTIRGHIGRNLRDRKKMAVFPEGEHGKEAVTHYKVLERLGYVTLVDVRLETGRTHQIRVHMAHIGHPLFNDATYGGDRIVKGTVYSGYKQFVENCFALFPRHALHARTLGFVHPATGSEMFFECPLPDDFQKLLEKWRSYFQKTVK
ncbi:MAG TPA: RluA family pseudouridine synthase [Chitinophagales bacterium]|nr:RluA family pseudouridine synthase [Chitinophagales bacterium]